MKQRGALLVLLVMTTNVQADDVSDECLLSMQNLYKFYYHEIVPKNSPSTPERLGEKETQEMEAVVGKLKNNCPPEIIAKMNQYLKSEDA